MIEIYGYSILRERAAQTTRTEYKADPNGEAPIGLVEWAITDGATSELLSEGTTTVLLKDVSIRIIEDPSKRGVSTSFPLTDHFILGISGGYYPSPDVRGFALTGDRDDVHTFCWDWFNVDGPNHATKHQESGELGIEIANPSGGWEVIRTEFLTDVSLRVVRFAEGRPDHPAWRIRLAKGSVITWPSLVDGKVIAN